MKIRKNIKSGCLLSRLDLYQPKIKLLLIQTVVSQKMISNNTGKTRLT